MRRFRPDPVPRGIVEQVLDVARLAPSAGNSQPWEFVVLTGPSGCGKSTVAFSIVNFLGPNGNVSNGQILFKGQELRGRSEADLRRLRGADIAMVYQELSLAPHLTVAENIAMHHKLNIVSAPPLIDMDYGRWQGLTSVEAQKKYPEIYRCWVNSPEQAHIPDGETLDDITSRVLPFVRTVVAEHPGRVIMQTRIGGSRVVDMLTGEQLPRIC